MIDTHAHLEHEFFSPNQDQIIKNSLAQLKHIITIGTDIKTSSLAFQISQKHTNVSFTIGVHPEEVLGYLKSGTQSQLTQEFTDLFGKLPTKPCGVGEIGLDYHLDGLDEKQKTQQKKAFEMQLDYARGNHIPVIIHSRDAFTDTLEILKNFKQQSIWGVWHSFTLSQTEVLPILDLNLLIGINGIVTFPSATNLQEAVKHIPLEKLLIETDAPFLAPQDYRGKTCEPWMVKLVADKIASLKQTSLDKVEQITDQNAENIFKLNHV